MLAETADLIARAEVSLDAVPDTLERADTAARVATPTTRDLLARFDLAAEAASRAERRWRAGRPLRAEVRAEVRARPSRLRGWWRRLVGSRGVEEEEEMGLLTRAASHAADEQLVRACVLQGELAELIAEAALFGQLVDAANASDGELAQWEELVRLSEATTRDLLAALHATRQSRRLASALGL